MTQVLPFKLPRSKTFTIAKFAEANRVSDSKARAILVSALADGILIVAGTKRTGKRGRPARLYAAA